MECREPILSDWKHHSEEEMIPNELNMTQMAHHPPIGSNAASVHAIIHAMHHAMTREERIPTFAMALKAFSHKNTDLHSYEIDMGAVHALILQLGYCLSSHRNTQAMEESTLICQCIFQILAHCPTGRRVSLWEDIGLAEMLPLCLQAGSHSWYILALLCRLPVAKANLIRYPGLLESALYVLQTCQNHPGHEIDDQSHLDIVTTVLGAIKDLSFQTKPRDKQMLWELPGLTKQLAVMVSMKRDEQDPTAQRQKEYIATFWWNLALSVSEMQTEPQILHSLQQLLQDQSNAKIRQSAIAALGNLLSSEILQQNDSFWNQLLYMALREADVVCRRRVVRSLRCLLATTATQTTLLLTTTPTNRPSAMYVLVQVAMNDRDTDIRLQALEGLRHLQPSAKKDVWTKGIIGIMESGGDVKVAWMACQMLSEDAEIPHLSHSFWTIAFELIHSVQESHATIIRILDSIVKSGNHDKILESPQALMVVGQLLMTEHRPLELLRTLVLKGKQRIVECDAILSSLVTICLSTSDQKEKDELKSIILELVPEL